MAVTSIWPIKNGVRDVIVYACNPEKTTEENRTALHSVANVIEYAADELKTERCEYVTGINCRQDNAISVFNETRKRWGKEKDKVLNPTAYWQSKGIGRGGKKTQPNPYKWGKTTVEKILSKQEYCGDIINFKTYSKSFKNKKRYDNAEDNLKIFKDVNEPIIDRQAFENVQDMIKRAKRRAPKPENAQKSIFSGLMRCADCGHTLR